MGVKQAWSRSLALGPEYHFCCIRVRNSGKVHPSKEKWSPEHPGNCRALPFERMLTPKHSSDEHSLSRQEAEYLSSKVTVDAYGTQK